MSPISVTAAFVEDGEIIGTPYCWATRPPARLRELATSPMMATT